MHDQKLGPVLCIVRMSSVEDLAIIFFNWCYENGLPMGVECDRNTLAAVKFWKVLMKLAGIKLKCPAQITLK